MKKTKNVNEYIALAPKEVRGKLKELRAVIRKAAPKAEEKISYGMPFYEYGGSGYKGRLIYFATFKKHIGVFIPFSLGKCPRELEKYRTAKSSFNFPLNKPFPFALIGKTVKVLVKGKNAKKKT